MTSEVNEMKHPALAEAVRVAKHLMYAADGLRRICQPPPSAR